MIGKILLIFLLGVVISRDITEAEVTIAFGKFLKEYNKKYPSLDEMTYRYEIFSENYRQIEEHNQNSNFELGINQFADMTMKEIKANYLSYKKNKKIKPCTLKHVKGEAKEEINWVTKGKVSPVKNQGSCGSWAFSAIGALEGLYAIKNGKILEFSEQELIDCTMGWNDNHGCRGGDMSIAFEYIKENSISLRSEYPFTAHNGKCKKVSKSFNISGCVNVTKNDSDELLEALNKGPVSITVRANNNQFMYYRRGIIDSGCGTSHQELDHAITLVGAGYKDGKAYWLAKNSWGKNWGQGGYVYIERNFGKGEGRCGITIDNCYPMV